MSVEQQPRTPAPAGRVAWEPTRRSRRMAAAARGDGPALRALRTAAYVLTALASLVFLVLVTYGTVQYLELRAAVQEFVGGPGEPWSGGS